MTVITDTVRRTVRTLFTDLRAPAPGRAMRTDLRIRWRITRLLSTLVAAAIAAAGLAFVGAGTAQAAAPIVANGDILVTAGGTFLGSDHVDRINIDEHVASFGFAAGVDALTSDATGTSTSRTSPAPSPESTT